MKNIRNFCIIAHIDHGKSTLADRLLEYTGTVLKRDMQEQLLDSMDIERERGITVKLTPVRMNWTYQGEDYILDLIDTPGHVDFSYEVSRSLVSCEGALLLVDATQGIQAQTLSHLTQALELGLTIIPVLNKIDLPAAEPERVAHELEETFGFLPSEMIYASGKTGKGVDEILKAIIERVPPPRLPLVDYARALIFDSFYDVYKGVVCSVKVFDGEFRGSDFVRFFATDAGVEILELGYFKPGMVKSESIKAGEVGYIATGLKDVGLCRVGDTIIGERRSDLQEATMNLHDSEWKKQVAILAGYKEMRPMVFTGLYPIDADDFPKLKDALYKLKLNDSSLEFAEESSLALGHGFRVGFLGLLHAEITHDRLNREFDLDVIVTTPSVGYIFNGEEIKNPSDIPSSALVLEPWTKVTLICPSSYVGTIIQLCQDHRGILKDQTYLGPQAKLLYEIPLAELVVNFYDKLKSFTSGYASMDYEPIDYREVEVVRLDIMVAGDVVDALSYVLVKTKAESFGRNLVEKLKEVLPRQNFAIALQAAIGGKIVARETIAPFRKDVIAKLYGGDVTRKNKLLEKQKKGKKKMKEIGRVSIPQEAFLEVLRVGS
jgi:GTP-binding protein LepA